MKRWIAVLGVLLAVTGCSGLQKGEPEVPCPQTGFVMDADRVSKKDADAWMTGFKYVCHYRPQDGYYIEMSLPLMATKKAGTTALSVRLPYFISLLSPQEEILKRNSFAAEIEFGDNGNGQEVEEHNLHVPGMTPETAAGYKIALGFALTPEERAANQQHKTQRKAP